MEETQRARIARVVFPLDLGFSDLNDGENVRELTLQRRLDEIEAAVGMMTTEEALNFSLLMSYGVDHPSAELYAADFPSALRASLYVLLGGYYRQAMACLREWFEIRLTGVYYGLVERDVTRYAAWKSGAQGPIGRGLVRKLFARAEFRKTDGLELRQRLCDVYCQLSAFAHGSGLDQHGLQLETDNVPRCNPQSVDLWFEHVGRAFSEVVFCYFVAYGTASFSQLEDKGVEVLRKHVRPEYQKEMEAAGIV